MKIETLSERITNAENKISKKQLTIAKKQALIAKKQQLIEAKGLANSDSPEALTLKWDIEHYTDDISRLEREMGDRSILQSHHLKVFLKFPSFFLMSYMFLYQSSLSLP